MGKVLIMSGHSIYYFILINLYFRIDEITEDTDPFREYDADTGKMYCKALGGSCFHVQYYYRNFLKNFPRQDLQIL